MDLIIEYDIVVFFLYSTTIFHLNMSYYFASLEGMIIDYSISKIFRIEKKICNLILIC
jgi:hypothetical protein